eukprot:5260457-Pleurochrysis_carterae.AAC.1
MTRRRSSEAETTQSQRRTLPLQPVAAGLSKVALRRRAGASTEPCKARWTCSPDQTTLGALRLHSGRPTVGQRLFVPLKRWEAQRPATGQRRPARAWAGARLVRRDAHRLEQHHHLKRGGARVQSARFPLHSFASQSFSLTDLDSSSRASIPFTPCAVACCCPGMQSHPSKHLLEHLHSLSTASSAKSLSTSLRSRLRRCLPKRACAAQLLKLSQLLHRAQKKAHMHTGP